MTQPINIPLYFTHIHNIVSLMIFPTWYFVICSQQTQTRPRSYRISHVHILDRHSKPIRVAMNLIWAGSNACLLAYIQFFIANNCSFIRNIYSKQCVLCTWCGKIIRTLVHSMKKCHNFFPLLNQCASLMALDIYIFHGHIFQKWATMNDDVVEAYTTKNMKIHRNSQSINYLNWAMRYSEFLYRNRVFDVACHITSSIYIKVETLLI